MTSILVEAAPQRRATGITVVGIPARNEAATVGAVAEAADAGLARAFPDGGNAIVLAENGSTDGTAERFLETSVRAGKFAVRTEATGTGKGTNVFAIFAKARELDADRVVLLDADVRSASADWVGLLADAVRGDAPAVAVPVYRRNRYEANSTNHLVRPLLAGVFGAGVQQPIGGEFAFNRAFLEEALTWSRPESAYLYGIDVWLTGNALRAGHRVAQVPLGRKLHNSPFPKILSLPQQVLDSLLHVATELDRPAATGADLTPEVTGAVDGAAVRQDPAVIEAVSDSVCRYLERHLTEVGEIFPTALELEFAPWGLRVGREQWPILLAEALAGVAAGRFQAARDHLIALFVNRVLTFWTEIEGRTEDEVNALLARQAADTAVQIGRQAISFGPDSRPPGAFDRGYWTDFG
ncbi:MAG TPA: glycosyltransferase [Pseudonocardiaceae bacterium]|nr:glycosyltransferase [Pseudonocardiaceae bacterium]